MNTKNIFLVKIVQDQNFSNKPVLICVNKSDKENAKSLQCIKEILGLSEQNNTVLLYFILFNIFIYYILSLYFNEYSCLTV